MLRLSSYLDHMHNFGFYSQFRHFQIVLSTFSFGHLIIKLQFKGFLCSVWAHILTACRILDFIASSGIFRLFCTPLGLGILLLNFYSVVHKIFPPVWNSRLISAKQNGQPMHSQLALTEHVSLNLAPLILLDPVFKGFLCSVWAHIRTTCTIVDYIASSGIFRLFWALLVLGI